MMPEITERRRNLAPWMAFLLMLAALALNVGSFFGLPGGRTVLWPGLLLALAALACSALGVKRAYSQPRVYGGKIAGPVSAFLAIAVCALLTFGWIAARSLPTAGEAPQVGQRAPAFTLADTQGNQVSLAQLLAGGDTGSAHGSAPKAVLLVFYRGYW